MKFPAPKIIIFDVDGVLVDVRESFHRTVIETVLYFTGKRVKPAEIHEWKNRSGFNDDWTLSTAWVRSLGFDNTYDEVKKKFVDIYWGAGKPGNVSRERWILPKQDLRRLANLAELALFTGRVPRRTRLHTRSNWCSLDIQKNCDGGRCHAPEAQSRRIAYDSRWPRSFDRALPRRQH
jgi:hypothetical protein